jgi:hypothetical protein
LILLARKAGARKPAIGAAKVSAQPQPLIRFAPVGARPNGNFNFLNFRMRRLVHTLIHGCCIELAGIERAVIASNGLLDIVRNASCLNRLRSIIGSQFATSGMLPLRMICRTCLHCASGVIEPNIGS